MSDRCEPPAGAEDGSWWWMSFRVMPRRLVPMKWHDGEWWDDDGEVGSPQELARDGWSVNCRITPPAEVAALQAEVARLRAAVVRLVEAGERVLSLRIGSLPHLGWLPDNNVTRAALGLLSDHIAAAKEPRA